MEDELRKLIEEWIKRSERLSNVASQEFAVSNWQMGNVDSAAASAYRTAALQLQELLDKHK